MGEVEGVAALPPTLTGARGAAPPSADRLLDAGMAVPRPVPPDGLVQRLRARLGEGVAGHLLADGGEVVVGKARLTALHRCEGLAVAEAARPKGSPSAALVAGLAVHRAIPAVAAGLPADGLAAAAFGSLRRERPEIERWAASLNDVETALLLGEAQGAVEAYRDDWPPLPAQWRPRWEPRLSARVPVPGGGLVLHARPDLVLGTPRQDRQSMVVVDFKSGPLRDGHEREARFHALLAALRFGVPPWRSAVWSTASGTYTHPADVTEQTLMCAADEVVDAVRRGARLDDGGAPDLTPGPWCQWCPAADGCPEAA